MLHQRPCDLVDMYTSPIERLLFDIEILAASGKGNSVGDEIKAKRRDWGTPKVPTKMYT